MAIFRLCSAEKAAICDSSGIIKGTSVPVLFSRGSISFIAAVLHEVVEMTGVRSSAQRVALHCSFLMKN